MPLNNTKIQFKDSEIDGIEETSLNGKKYYAFLGIPYAEPPLGNLRFKNPQILENFPKNLNATKFKNRCIQYSHSKKSILGSEDCLYLNIYIPKLPPFDSLLPVMVYIHGGTYFVLSGNRLTPNLLIEHNIIFVTFNFRLHALGFLDLGLPDCTGNMGLKDQLCALQWVKNNIKYFGGDSDNITLLGVSSGAVCAHMLAVSPLNRNLSNKLILLGHNGLHAGHINHTPSKLAFEIGRKFGYEGNDKNALLQLLKSVSAEELLRAVVSSHDEAMLRPISGNFGPTIEEIKEGALLPDYPMNLWRKVTNVSVIVGENEKEGSFLFFSEPKFSELVVRYDALKVFINDTIIPVQKNFLDGFFEEIISFYGISEINDEKNFNARLNLFSDLLLLHNYHTTSDFLRPISNSYSVYRYKFAYCGQHNLLKNLWNKYFRWNVEGTFHIDEWAYMMLGEKWYSPVEDIKVANTICTLWANFVKYGTPNGEIFNSWVPWTRESSCYLQIDENLTMKYDDFNSEKAKFWKYLIKKYSIFAECINHND